MRKLLSLALLSMLVIAACGPVIIERKEIKQKVVLIFSDVTSSLMETESASVANLTSDVIDSLTPGTKFSVVPIQVQPERLSAMNEDVIAPVSSSSADVVIKRNRRERLTKRIDELYKKIREFKVPAPPYGSPDNHSCILGTLSYAESYFRQFPEADLELVYISDMIEECNETPFGRAINLAQPQITTEIAEAQSLQTSFDLGRARVTVIIPTNDDTYIVGMRPPLSNVKEFWEKVFMKCGFDQHALKANHRFYFRAGLPDRFKPSG